MKPGLAFCFIIYTTFAFPQKRSAEIAQLVSWHVGHFDSQLQSQENKSYFNIQLNAVQIWKHRKDGYWLYVEQAVSDQLNAPYRQRVYRIVHTDSAIIREEFIIPQALRYAGGYKFKRPLDELSRDSLLKRAGCEVDFKFDSGRFVGKTHLKTCPSEIRGVTYAMSEVEISPGRMTNWDRGFNDKGEMAWGVAKGPYVFDKKSSYDLTKVKQKAEKLIPLVAPAMAEEIPEIALDTIPPTPTVLGDLKMLVAYLSGHFESKNQTPDQVNYYDVQLDVIPIWKKKKDDYWLYVEEATAERAAVTYHQQVFHVYKMGSLFLRETYTIRNPMRYEGPKRFRKTLRRLRQDSLEIITGCEVYFRYDSGRFVGQTNRLTCPTKIPGAASGMQELLVSDSQMKSLDRGFDEAGEPVWGLVKGPFVFQRKRRE